MMKFSYCRSVRSAPVGLPVQVMIPSRTAHVSGAQFTFTFDPLLAGQSRTFKTFYGVAPTETAALAALGVVGAEVYSFGQSRAGPTDFKAKETFIFAFKGVGGTVIHGVPEPTSWALMIMGAGLVGTSLRTSRRRRIALAA